MINPELLNLDGSFDLPAYLLGEVYGPIQVDGRHIDWSMERSVSLANDLKRYDGIDADPQEIYEIMMEFDAQDNEELAHRQFSNEEADTMTIEIYWKDLTAEKQQELLNLLGDNGNYDVFPIVVLEFEKE